MHYSNTRHNRKLVSGFTLLESMFSILILGVGILGILHFLTGSIKSNTMNNPRAMAINSATEELINNYSDASGGPNGIHTRLDALITGVDVINNNNTYTMTVMAARDSSGADLIETVEDPPDSEIMVTRKTTAYDIPGNWISPITVGLEIKYTVNGNTNKVFVPQTLVF